MAKYRVVDKKRFYTFIAIVVVIAIAAISTIFSMEIKAAEPAMGPTNSGLQKILDEYDLDLVTVKPGDTYWQIQEELLPDEDVRELKFYAEFINEKPMGELQAWEKIFVFTEKED